MIWKYIRSIYCTLYEFRTTENYLELDDSEQFNCCCQNMSLQDKIRQLNTGIIVKNTQLEKIALKFEK